VGDYHDQLPIYCNLFSSGMRCSHKDCMSITRPLLLNGRPRPLIFFTCAPPNPNRNFSSKGATSSLRSSPARISSRMSPRSLLKLLPSLSNCACRLSILVSVH
jgi:hypothetical protein